MRNLITDVAGIRVGNADDARLASGVTALIFDRPAVASIAVHGGAPGLRDTAMLEPDMTVEAVDALVLSGGSGFGLDAAGGVQAHLRSLGRGFPIREARVPIVPAAILFDLLNGGDKAWGAEPVYWHLGAKASAAAATDFALGSVGAGLGALTVNLKGGLGSASATVGDFTVGALVVVNAVGSATVGDSPQFWAAPYERDGEFGGLGFPAKVLPAALAGRIKGDAPENTTIAIVATDATLTKGEAKRIAVMAHDGLARALRPAHAPMDGDVVFAAGTSLGGAPTPRERASLGLAAADCLARAIARAVYLAESLPFSGALPSWRDRFGATGRR